MTKGISAFTLGSLIVACATPACTFSDGDWFANLRPTFQARYASRADRDVSGGWQKLNTLYQVRMLRALITVRDVQLQDLGSGGGGAIFNPAAPPPGYSLCHNGHCHHDDGRLVPYDEIAADLAAGGASNPRTVVSLPVGATDLLTPVRREITCQPGCGIDEAHIRRARATLTHVTLEGIVRDSRSPARLEGEVPWLWDAALTAGAALPPVTLDGEIDLPADAVSPPDVRLDLTLETSAKLLDDIEWTALARDSGVIDLVAPSNAAARDQLHTNLAEATLRADITRND